MSPNLLTSKFTLDTLKLLIFETPVGGGSRKKKNLFLVERLRIIISKTYAVCTLCSVTLRVTKWQFEVYALTHGSSYFRRQCLSFVVHNCLSNQLAPNQVDQGCSKVAPPPSRMLTTIIKYFSCPMWRVIYTSTALLLIRPNLTYLWDCDVNSYRCTHACAAIVLWFRRDLHTPPPPSNQLLQCLRLGRLGIEWIFPLLCWW